LFEQVFKNINDFLWTEKGCSTELDYTEQTSWILFLKYLDDLERAKEQLKDKSYQYIGAAMKAKLLASRAYNGAASRRTRCDMQFAPRPRGILGFVGNSGLS
jgi:hypothetical protein